MPGKEHDESYDSYDSKDDDSYDSHDEDDDDRMCCINSIIHYV